MDETIRDFQAGRICVQQYLDRLEEIKVFERQLCDNGYLLVKLFLHIDKKEQQERLEHLRKNADTTWRVSEHDLWQNHHYPRVWRILAVPRRDTDLPFAPWHVIDSTHRKQSEIDCLHMLCAAIEEASSKRPTFCPPLTGTRP